MTSPRPAPNVKWVGDITEIPTDEGKLYLATVIDLYSRRLLGYPTSAHPDVELAAQAIMMAVATRGGAVAGVIFHSDRGSTYTANDFTTLCETCLLYTSDAADDSLQHSPRGCPFLRADTVLNNPYSPRSGALSLFRHPRKP